jgi:ketosteroid isomerase-like protein
MSVPGGLSAAMVQRRGARPWLAGLALGMAMMAAAPVAAATGATSAQPGTDIAASNRALVRAAFDAWAAGTGSVFDLLREDVTWTVAGRSPVSGTYSSREDFLARAVEPIAARLATPIVPRLRHLVAQGNTVVAVFDGAATAHDGREYRNSYAWHMVLEDGRIVRVVAFLDTWALQALMEG